MLNRSINVVNIVRMNLKQLLTALIMEKYTQIYVIKGVLMILHKSWCLFVQQFQISISNFVLKAVFNRTKWDLITFLVINVDVLRYINLFVLQMVRLMLMIVTEFVTKQLKRRAGFVILILLKVQIYKEIIILNVLSMDIHTQMSLY